MCDCGCGTCDKSQKGITLNESIAPKQILSEGLQYHINHKIPLTEHVYRAGSSAYFNLWAEARALYARNILEVKNTDDLEILNETNLGHFGIIYEIEVGDQVKASKEYGGLSGEVVDVRGSFIVVKTKEGNKSYHKSDLEVLNKEGKKVPLDFPIELNEQMDIYDDIANREFGMNYDQLGSKEQEWVRDEIDNMSIDKDKEPVGSMKRLKEWDLNEAKKKAKKKTPKLNKPMRSSSGGKAYKVYVRDPKTGNIKTVRFGSGGLRAKLDNPKARKAFAARHKCGTGEPKTSARYWSCRIGRYWKLLGGSKNFSGFW